MHVVDVSLPLEARVFDEHNTLVWKRADLCKILTESHRVLVWVDMKLVPVHYNDLRNATDANENDWGNA